MEHQIEQNSNMHEYYLLQVNMVNMLEEGA